jgi:catechol 2,3-dioxygenase-like lactoylglutathione lyase family enzyme
MQITRALHTAILITNLEKSQHFYSQVLGLTQVERNLKYPGLWYQIGDYQIHLIVAKSVPTQDQNEQLEPIPHVAFSVVDLAVVKAELLQQNYPMQPSLSGRAAIFIKDPDGNMIELSQQ